MTDSERYAHVYAILSGYELGRYDNEPEFKERVEQCLIAGIEALGMSTGNDLYADFSEMIRRGCLYDLFAMIGVSTTRWEHTEYNEALANGDSHCYWVCWVGEDDSLETYSTKKDYYSRLFNLWDWWIEGGSRYEALEPFDNEFDLAQKSLLSMTYSHT